jgi:hypothetical protein
LYIYISNKLHIYWLTCKLLLLWQVLANNKSHPKEIVDTNEDTMLKHITVNCRVNAKLSIFDTKKLLKLN